MFRIVLLTGLATLAVPAIAQDTQHPATDAQTGQPHAVPPESSPPEATPPAEAMPPADPQPPAQTMPQSGPQPPASEATPAPGEARPATPGEVGAMVESEFPSRDGDGDGSLNQAEFTTWLGELVARSPDGNPPSEEQIASAFTQTDSDGNGSVSPAEMTALLARSR